MLGEILTTVRTIGRTFELTSSMSEFTSLDFLDDVGDGVDIEDRSQRTRAQLRVMRFLPGAVLRFIKGSVGRMPGTDEELLAGFSHLPNDLDWAKDREALLAAYFIIARKGGADLDAIVKALAPIADAATIRGASELAAIVAPGKALPDEPLSVSALQSSDKPLRRTGRKAARC
jgi:hypothetical protein